MSFWDKVPVVGSIRKCNKAERIVKYAKDEHYVAKRNLEDAQRASEMCVDDLFDLKTTCSTKVIPEALDVLERCHKINRLDTTVNHDVYEKFSLNSSPSLIQQTVTVEEVVAAGAKGTAAGSALALGSMSLVTTFGAASTGTAITSLSGVAATNATMAWFGGGALSAGGAGMAGGAVVLGGVVLAPLVVLGAFKFASHAEEKLTAAQNYSDEVDTLRAKDEISLPTQLGVEKQINPFLRSNVATITDELPDELKINLDLNEPWQRFSGLRAWKDNF